MLHLLFFHGHLYLCGFLLFDFDFKMDTPTALRSLVIEKYLLNMSQRSITSELNIPKSTVNDIIQSFRRTNEEGQNRLGKCGRERILSSRDDRFLSRASEQQPRATASQLQQQSGGLFNDISLSTVKDHYASQEISPTDP